MSTQILQVGIQYSLYSGCITFVLGVIGNALNILVFTQLKLLRDNRSAFYLTADSTSCFFIQFVPIATTILTSIYGNDGTGTSVVWCKFRYMLPQVFGIISHSTVCLAAADQFFSTNYFCNLRQMCTLKLARYLMFAFVCFWIVHGIIFGWYYDIQPSFGCVISNTIWLQYLTYMYFPILGGLLPITIASSFSILAYRNVRRIVRRQIPIVSRRLDQQMTAMVLMRVILFICFVSPFTIYRIYNINFPLSPTQPMQYAVGRLLQVIFFNFVYLNHGMSFYVYAIGSSRFRRQVKFFLVKKCWQRFKFWCCFTHNKIVPDGAQSSPRDMELEEIG